MSRPVMTMRHARQFARALRDKPRAERPDLPPPTEHAPDREGCPRCGVPGFKGCDHYLPCLPVTPERSHARHYRISGN